MILQKVKELFHYFIVPQRLVFCYFGFLAIINAYAMRSCFDFALRHIVNDYDQSKLQPAIIMEATTTKPMIIDTTPMLLATRHRPIKRTTRIQRISGGIEVGNFTLKAPIRPLIEENKTNQHWSKSIKSIVLISFYVGYICSHIPGGRLAERYGGKWVLGIGILVSAIFTLLTPSIIWHGGPLALIGTRFIIGLSEGPTFPSLSTMLAHWLPIKERGKLGVFVLSAGQIGIVWAHLMSGIIIQQGNEWSMLFYFFGSCALLWFFSFVLLCSSDPDENPYIENEEKYYIQNERRLSAGNSMLDWRSMLKNTPLWALVSATIQHDWQQMTLANDLQVLLNESRQKSLPEYFYACLVSLLPYILNWLSSLGSGVLSDFVIENHLLTTTVIRKMMAILAIVSASMFCSSSAYNNNLVKLLTCIWSVLGTGAYYAGVKLLPLDMNPKFAGTIMGIANGLGSLPNVIMPFLQELELGNNKIFISLRSSLWLFTTILISGEVQDYDDHESVESTDDKNK